MDKATKINRFVMSAIGYVDNMMITVKCRKW